MVTGTATDVGLLAFVDAARGARLANHDFAQER